MFDKSNLIKSLAVALLGGALVAAPALAQNIGANGARVGGSSGAAAPAPGAGGAPPGGSVGGNHFNAMTAPSLGAAAPRAGSSNYVYNGSGHHHDHGDHHHHGHGAFAFGFFGGPDYYDNWAYEPDYGPDCTLRHVRIYHNNRHYWVWRRYCD